MVLIVSVLPTKIVFNHLAIPISDKMREELLSGFNIGDKIRVKKDDNIYEGILMPHHRFSDEDIVTLKLDNGYNIGIEVDEGTELELIEESGEKEEIEKAPAEFDEEKADISIISTGGTIASYVEYRTGAVHPAETAEDMIFSIPEIADRCDPSLKILFSKLSEDMNPKDWVDIADEVIEEFKEGAEGVVIAHGTDTMGYTASALSFLLSDLDRTVVLVGSQRSSDRPSSDAALNLLGAIEVSKSDMPGVFVVMHGSMSDDRCAVHLGTKVRKMHTSRRDAFQSINTEPVGWVDPHTGEIEAERITKDKNEKLERKGNIDPSVSLLYAHPGMTEEDLPEKGEKQGLVIAGTGLGHVNSRLIPRIKELAAGCTDVVMTSQCLNGTVNDYVYSNGRKLVEAGVIQGRDMLPETALVKLMWALSLEEDVEQVMKTNIAGEITERRVR